MPTVALPAAGGRTIASDDPRVATLLPSATETCFALGVEPVATSAACDHPPAARDLPTVVESRVDPDGTSAAIDRQVREAADGDGVYVVDREALAGADPDLVVTQGLCDVCAVDGGAVREAVADLGLDCEVLETHPHSLEDVFEDVRRIGAATGREDRAADLLDDLRSRVEAVESTAAEAPFRPEVVVLDWLDPVMVAGHWVPELVEIAGGTHGMAASAEVSRPREWAEVREYDPDVLVAAPCGFDLERTFANLGDLREREGWRQLRAVRMNRAYAVDGHHLTNRPGPRLVETLETLAALIHPESFDVPEPWMSRPLSAGP